jgi:hypothetical protein
VVAAGNHVGAAIGRRCKTKRLGRGRLTRRCSGLGSSSALAGFLLTEPLNSISLGRTTHARAYDRTASGTSWLFALRGRNNNARREARPRSNGK